MLPKKYEKKKQSTILHVKGLDRPLTGSSSLGGTSTPPRKQVMPLFSSRPLFQHPSAPRIPCPYPQARFARVQALGASTANAAAEPGSAAAVDGGGHWQEGKVGLERLEILAPTDPASAGPPLPSAQEVWSPIIALRTFVEPLTSRASAAFRHFHVSFFDGVEEEGGGGGVGGVAVATATAVVAGAASPPPAVAVAEAATADEEGRGGTGNDARECARRREEEQFAPRDSSRSRCAAVEERGYYPQGLGGVALGAASSGYGRAVLEGERARQEGKYMDAEDVGDDAFERRVAV